jgi:uncharacterized protein (TIGR02271 family)
MSRTIVGLFKDRAQAEQAVRDLVDEGIDRDDISVVARDGERGVADVSDDNVGDTATGAVAGAGGGAVLGGLAGVLLGLGALAIPGIGPIIAAGPIVAGLTGAGIGAATGGLVGALVSAGVPEGEAKYYEEGVRQGGALVIVKNGDAAVGVEDILQRNGAYDTRGRSEQPFAETEASYDRSAADVAPEYGRAGAERDVAIPVVEEQLEVGKRQVERGGVRVHTNVEEIPVEQDVSLRDERVYVERRPVDRPITEADEAALQNTGFELRERTERPVVDKQARVVEEVVINKDVTEHQERVSDTVRRTDVDVEDTRGNVDRGPTRRAS